MEGACKQGGGVDLWGQVLKVVVKVSLSRGLCTGCVLTQTMGTPQRNKVLVGICRNQQGRNSPSGLRRSETELNAKEPFLEISAHVRSVKHCCTRTAEDFALFLNKISVFIFFKCDHACT